MSVLQDAGGKAPLGPQTRKRVDEINAAAVQAYDGFLSARQSAGELAGDRPVSAAARYLSEQIALALLQRAADTHTEQIQVTLELALSVLRRR